MMERRLNANTFKSPAMRSIVECNLLVARHMKINTFCQGWNTSTSVQSMQSTAYYSPSFSHSICLFIFARERNKIANRFRVEMLECDRNIFNKFHFDWKVERRRRSAKRRGDINVIRDTLVCTENICLILCKYFWLASMFLHTCQSEWVFFRVHNT